MSKVKIKSLSLIVVFVLFIVYQFSANYIFIYLLRPEGESTRVNIYLPEYISDDIRFSISNIIYAQVDWKDMINIRGWVFREGTNRLEYDVIIVIRSESDIYFYDSFPEERLGVRQVFGDEMGDNLEQSGFFSFIPLEAISDGIHQIGLLMKNRYTDEVFYHPVPVNHGFLKQGTLIQFPVN